MTSIAYPIRINRYLSLKGMCTRKEADVLIQKGKVRVNGNTAVLGTKISKSDVVEIVGSVRAHGLEYRYFAYNKPKGVVSSAPQGNEETAAALSGLGKNFFPVGRLDKNSRGLLVLTNDGRIVDRLLSPKYAHEKEYVVSVDKKLRTSALHSLQKGVRIEGYRTKSAVVKKINDRTFSIVLTEGKKHQIRRMTMAIGYQVTDLKRVRIMNIRLGSLKEGTSRELGSKERETLLVSLAL